MVMFTLLSRSPFRVSFVITIRFLKNLVIITEKKTMMKVSINARWVGQNVVVCTRNLSHNVSFHANTLASAIRRFADEREFEVVNTTWYPPISSPDKLPKGLVLDQTV